MNRPLVTVLGATSAAGRGFASALRADPARRYDVRAVIPSAAAADGAPPIAAGSEVVRAELDDPASLARVLAGSHGVLTSTEGGVERVANIADAAVAVGAAHVIVEVTHHAAHSDAKKCFVEKGLPVTFVHAGWSWEHLIDAGMGPQRADDGGLDLVLPVGGLPLPGIAADDIGAVVVALFERRHWVLGRSVGIAGEVLGGAQMAEAIARAIGEPVRHRPLDRATYEALGFAGAADLADEVAWVQGGQADVEFDVDATRMLHPGLLGFEAWLARQVHRLPIPAAARRA
jgi:hypothetical protein